MKSVDRFHSFSIQSDSDVRDLLLKWRTASEEEGEYKNQ